MAEDLKFLSLVAAMDIHGLIGNGNNLPWPRIKSDMKRFFTLTRNHDIIMGRKTFDSLGKPLPKRHNIILSRGTIDESLLDNNCTVVPSLAGAIATAKRDPEIFVIGGAKIYTLALPHVRRMYITTVHRSFCRNDDSDIYFPAWEKREWEKIEGHSIGARGEIPTSFEMWERK